jgi:hypothetical protein
MLGRVSLRGNTHYLMCPNGGLGQEFRCIYRQVMAGQRPSRLRPSVKLAKHFVHGVDDRLRLVQLNLVT